ncbi:MAG: hypothetical protein M3362_23270, partial [Acidobacteriota bacterium]|nr:hypothetical protein [Acidobacteriota bacterium]
MYRYIWLVPLLPLTGAAINGLLGRKFRFSEKLIGGIAVGTVALSFLLSVMAVWSYGWGSDARWPQAFVTTQFTYTWIPGGTVQITQGERERAAAESNQAEGQTRPGEPRAATAQRGKGRGSLLNIEWSYQLDPLSAIFMLVVTGVGLCIFVFATGYMHGDTGFYRFFAYLGLFMFSMLVLVMGSNFVMMFVGWEGVGLCSYLL